MLDVLLYLFEHYMEDGREVPHDEAILKTLLKDAGFPQSEINKAFVWLEDLVRQRGADEEGDQAARESFRILSRAESARLGRECQGYLLSLERSGIINPLTRELVIERAMALDLEEIDIERFKLIIMMVLANQSGDDHLQDWLEALIFDNGTGKLH